jgi:hypothetical protein
MIGFSDSVETPVGSGVWRKSITERGYRGSLTRIGQTFNDESSVNGVVAPATTISVVADSYAIEHFLEIKYVWWAGEKWTVTQVVFTKPRLTLTLGEVFNG